MPPFNRPGGGPPSFHPEPRPVIRPEPPVFRPEPVLHPVPIVRPEPVIIPEPVYEPPVEPVYVPPAPVPVEQLVNVRTSQALVFAWRDGANGPAQPAGVYAVPASVANALVAEGLAVVVVG